MKVLIVDDCTTMRGIQKSVLVRLGRVEVVEAASGREALARLTLFTPDLILCDWNMPEMDGLGFVRALRVSDPRTPVIMITTESELPAVLEGIKAGASNYLLMPFTPDQLCQRIAETLRPVPVRPELPEAA